MQESSSSISGTVDQEGRMFIIPNTSLLTNHSRKSTNPDHSPLTVWSWGNSKPKIRWIFFQPACIWAPLYFVHMLLPGFTINLLLSCGWERYSKIKSSKIHLFPQERVFHGWRLVCFCSRMYAVIYKWVCSPTWGDILQWRSQHYIEALTQNTFCRTKWSSQFDIDVSSICHAVFCLNLMVKVAGQVWVGKWSISLQ